MPATCFICTETINTLEPLIMQWGSAIDRRQHGKALDGTWCSPRLYRLAVAPHLPSGDRTYFRYGPGGKAEEFRALKRVGGDCPTCGVDNGNYHHLNCNQELCPRHGTALVSCGCVLCLLSLLTTEERPYGLYSAGYHPADWGGTDP